MSKLTTFFLNFLTCLIKTSLITKKGFDVSKFYITMKISNWIQGEHRLQ